MSLRLGPLLSALAAQLWSLWGGQSTEPSRAAPAGQLAQRDTIIDPAHITHVVQLLVPLLHPGALHLLDLVAVHDVQDLITHSLQGVPAKQTRTRSWGGRRTACKVCPSYKRAHGMPPRTCALCATSPHSRPARTHLRVAAAAHGGQHEARPLLRPAVGAVVHVADGVGEALLSGTQDARLRKGRGGQGWEGRHNFRQLQTQLLRYETCNGNLEASQLLRDVTCNQAWQG